MVTMQALSKPMQRMSALDCINELRTLPKPVNENGLERQVI